MLPIRDHNPSSQVPFVTYALIALNVVIFVSYAGATDRQVFVLFDQWALFPERVTAGYGYLGLLTSMFLHGGWMHLGGNMLFLYIFGDNLEEHFGHLGFLLFYLLTGLAASALQIASDPGSAIPVVGASGAIAGVLGGYLLLFPKARVDALLILGFFVQVITVPAFLMLLFWFGTQIVGGVLSAGQPGGGVAYWAHAGGFAAGVAAVGATWLAGRRPRRVDGHPDHPATSAPSSRMPIIPRRRR